MLYLALEDDFQRIQSRMFMMYGVEDSEKLYFATAANKVGQGLNDQLENFIKEHADTKLIIIDTMQKIREFGGEAYSYASDYAIIGQLKQFADKHGVCLLIVHRGFIRHGVWHKRFVRQRGWHAADAKEKAHRVGCDGRCGRA